MAQRGILDSFTDTMQSPLFLGGAALLSGDGFGGAMNGMAVGNQFQNQQRALAEQTQQKAAYDDFLGNLPKGLESYGGMLRAAGPERGFDVASRLMPKPMSPMEIEMNRLGIDYKRAQIAKLGRESSGEGGKFGKSATIVQGQDGKYYAVRFGEDGTERINPLDIGGQNVTPSRGVMEVGDTLRDKTTGKVIANTGDSLAAAEQAKDEGKAYAKFKEAFPKVQTGYQMFVNKSDRLLSTIDRAIGRIGTSTSGFGALLSALPASEARALQGDLDTIRANVGFEELQSMRDASPTGGALGQVSEMENRLLQSVRAAIDQYQRGENLGQNLGIIRDSVMQMRQLKEDAYRSDSERFQGGGFRPQTQGAAPSSPASSPDADGWMTINGVRIREKR